MFSDTIFHEECVGHTTDIVDGRFFDTVKNQLARNGDHTDRIVLKIDVEGAEWASLLAVPDEILRQTDRMAVEFHWAEDDVMDWVDDERYLRVVARLRAHFEVAHIHFNNTSCVEDLSPFPSHAFEVLFVNRRLAVVSSPARNAIVPHPLDAPNNPVLAECAPKTTG